MGYREQALGEALRIDIDSVPVEPLSEYPIAGVYSFGRGLFERETILGNETRYKTLHRLHTGQVVLSRLKAFEGAIALVPEGLEGYYLSPEFPTFSVQQTADRGYLGHLCRWPELWRRLSAASVGIGARRERVHPERLLGVRVPMPRDLHEQRRVASRLDKVAFAFGQLKREASRVDTERLRSLIPATIDRELGLLAHDLPLLGSLVDFVSDVFRPGDDLGPAESFVGLQHIEPHSGRRIGSMPVGGEKGPKHRFAPGDITYPRLRPYQNKVWLADSHGLCSTDQYVLRPREGVSGEILSFAMRASTFLAAAIESTSSLQHPRIRKADLAAISTYRVPENRQEEALERLRKVIDRLTEAIQLRSANEARLEALEVSALNYAFNGKL